MQSIFSKSRFVDFFKCLFVVTFFAGCEYRTQVEAGSARATVAACQAIELSEFISDFIKAEGRLVDPAEFPKLAAEANKHVANRCGMFSLTIDENAVVNSSGDIIQMILLPNSVLICTDGHLGSGEQGEDLIGTALEITINSEVFLLDHCSPEAVRFKPRINGDSGPALD